MSDAPKKITMQLSIEEYSKAGLDVDKKNYSNQLREKLGLPIPVRDSMSGMEKALKQKLGKDKYKAYIKKLLEEEKLNEKNK